MNIRDDDPCNDRLSAIDNTIVDDTDNDNGSVLSKISGNQTDTVQTAPQPQNEWCEVVHKNKRRKQNNANNDE